MHLIAHRGFAAEHPENTLEAVRRAAPAADAIEVDARRCGSGEVVVIHDETVDRVTDGSGRVAGLTASELTGLSVLGSDQGVPTLAEVAAVLPRDTGLVVELKEPGLVVDVLDATAAVDDLTVCSFRAKALAECRADDPDVPRALNVLEPDGIAEAEDLGCVAVQPSVDACSSGFVGRAHDAGLVVRAWTVDDRSTARRLADAGVDGVIADRADVLD